MERSIDEGLLLTFLHHADAEQDDAALAKSANPHFRAEIEHLSQDASNAIHDLEDWMRLHEDAQKQDNGLTAENNDAMPLPRSFDEDDSSDDDISDDSDADNIWSLSAELSMLDAMYYNDPTSFLSPYLKDWQGSPHDNNGEAPPESALPRSCESITLDDSLFDDLDLRSVPVVLPLTTADGSAHSGSGSGTTVAVQFTGLVGAACRSIRTRQPLPRPTALTQEELQQRLEQQQQAQKSKTTGKGKSRRRSRFWRRIFRRWLRKQQKQQQPEQSKTIEVGGTVDAASTPSPSSSKITWLPFVMPFCISKDGTLCRTPRLMSYFEVHILNPDGRLPEEDTATTASSSQGSDSHSSRRITECIAIGMTAQSFDVTKSLPGWAPDSFGYHGEDGSLFYNQTQDIRQRGSRFGVGDVVGCGVDYRTSRLFVTRNGRFEGYSSLTLDAERLRTTDWYPTVGLDSHACVHLNFGTDRPFVYDLQAMIEIGKQV